jgi:hypothetical protein
MFPHERSLVQEMQGRPFVLLGVNNDSELETVKTSVKKNKINWRSFYDGSSGPICSAFDIHAFPTIMLIDHHGVIKFDSIRKDLDEEIESLVKRAEGDGMVGEKIAAELRVFRDKSGKNKIKAIAEALNGQSVVLRKEDDSTITVKLEDLSRSDQKYLQKVDLPSMEADGTGDAVAAEPSFREFRDQSGKFKVIAKLVEVTEDKVTLEKRDGSRIDVPLVKLGDADREYVKDQKR